MAADLRQMSGMVTASSFVARMVQGRRPSLGVPRRSAGVVATATVRPSPSALRRSAAGASPLALRPAAQLPRPRSRRGSGAAAPAVARAAGGSGAASPGVSPEGLKAVLQAILRDPWDTPARPWRTFWATKLAATVVSADDAAGQVEVLPVETSGLRPPADREDAVHRLKTNAVLYRQNYALVFLGALAFGAFRYRTGLWHLAALASLVSYALASSDRALGEAQLASGGRLVWNAKRVAGVDRALLIRAAPVVGFLAIAACPLATAQWVVASAILAAVLAVAHAILRPVDLESTFAQIWGDLASVKSREDVASAIKSAGDGLSKWWNSVRQEPPEQPPPVIVVMKGEAGGAPGWRPSPGGDGAGGAGRGGGSNAAPRKQLPPGERK